MPTIKISKHPAPDTGSEPITLPFGTLVFTGKDGQRTTSITYNPGEPVHQPYPLKAKHRRR
jgi:hypothetical protein